MFPCASFGNLFSGDGIIIFLILLLLFGAKRLPELAKGLGSAVREFSKAKDEIHHEMTRPSDPPAPPQIEPPRYTEPHVASTPDYHTSPISEPASHTAQDVVHDAMAATGSGAGFIQPQPSSPGDLGASPITEEQHHAPVHPAG